MEGIGWSLLNGTKEAFPVPDSSTSLPTVWMRDLGIFFLTDARLIRAPGNQVEPLLEELAQSACFLSMG